MSAPDIFAGFDIDELDDLAGRLLTAITAVVEFGRPAPEDDHQLYEAAITKAMLTSLAAFIAHPHTDADQQNELIAGAITYLRHTVVEMRSES